MTATDDPNQATAVATWASWQRGPVRAYKGSRADGGSSRKGAPKCVCCFPKAVSGQVVPLRFGVTLALCDDHRDPAFIQSRGGRDFLAAVSTVYGSLGLHSRRFSEALRGFVEDVRLMLTPTPRARPGSYAWPHLRTAAEERWAAGGTYHDGEAVVLALHAPFRDAVKPPSRQTVRRWWRQRRWLTPRPAPPPPPVRTPPLKDRRVTTHLNRRERHADLARHERRGPGTPPDPKPPAA